MTNQLSPAKPGDHVLAYCRVSTDTQGDDGYSLDDQARTLREFAASQGLVLDEGDIFSEAFSGARLFRPALDRLLVRAKSGNGRYKWLLVAKWDRLVQFDQSQKYDAGIFHHLIERAGLRAIDVSQPQGTGDDPMSNLMRDILGVFAGFERQMIAQRTKMGREARARVDGLYWGGRRPFGYQFAAGIKRGRPVPGGRLAPDPTEAPIVLAIYRLFLDGTPITSIARYLNRNHPGTVPTGSATRQAGRWSSRTVRYILGNPVYAGKLVLNKTTGVEPNLPQDVHRRVLKTRRVMRPQEEWIEVRGAVDALIEPADWARAQERLAERRRATSRSHRPYILRGLLFHDCGKPATGHSRRGPRSVANPEPPRLGTLGPDPRWSPRETAPLLLSADDWLEESAALANLPGAEQEPWGYYDPHRYYACEACDSLTLAFKVENLVWFWLADRLTDQAVLDGLAAEARRGRPSEIDAADRLRQRLNTTIKRRSGVIEQQGEARALIGRPGWSVSDVDAAVARLTGLVPDLDKEIGEIQRELGELEDAGPLDLRDHQRAELTGLLSGFQWSYHSPRLWHLLFAYFIRRIEWGREKGRRNRAFLRIHTTARLGAETVHTIPLPFRIETLERHVRENGRFSSFRWIMGTGQGNDAAAEELDAETMVRLFGPPANYSPYLSIMPPGAGRLSGYEERFLDIADLLIANDPDLVSTRSGATAVGE